MITEIVFFMCLGALLLTYVLYPASLWLAARVWQPQPRPLLPNDALHPITVLIPVHNAALRIVPKLINTLQAALSVPKLSITVGLDGCTDDTDVRVMDFTRETPCVHIVRSEMRIGKSALLNRMIEAAETNVLVITDVDAQLEPGTIALLVAALSDVAVGIASSELIPIKPNTNAIAIAESQYTNLESVTKYIEGQYWGASMGAFGPCYGLRKHAFSPIPAGFVGDDLFVTLAALHKGYRSILVRGASAGLAVATDARAEFVRKARIAAGSYQNLGYWLPRLFHLPVAAAITFLLHKVLRWLGPLWLLGMLMGSFMAAINGKILGYLLPVQLGCLLLACGLVVRKHSFPLLGPLNRIGHFYAMHMAMAVGFFRYATGRVRPHWQPTARS